MSIRHIWRRRASRGWYAGAVSLFLILALNFSVAQAAFRVQEAMTISWFYAAAFERTPVPNSALPGRGDLGGLIFWTDAFIAGEGGLAQYNGNLDAIGDFFVASDEFQSRYPAVLTNEQFVTMLYNNMLSREPDRVGLDFWVNELNSGESRGTVLVDFANTQQFINY